MAEKLKLEIITPYGKVVDAEVDEVMATGVLGEFCVLPGHAPFLSSLKIGEFCYRVDGVAACMALNWGYFEVQDDRVVVLVETAEHAHEIDVERARVAQARAEQALKGIGPEDKQFKIYEAALERALIRMQVAGRETRK
ncbi:F0F1 ATP synthase subunit epsilon [Pelobacter propionicus]|uniref:ATP synthase epsilon chain n=1 Tax=Pelobacter propionicus (strain DSM 2379 / NBRC 103807 / OttBd1) TaxID=338966 RepID=A1ALL8_PELPD|nr:F0F1 ATP synthase subunit epsilon [Pelobacter propionicus]ABK98238.1 ATP synthase F1 subcomplex epsilon subunit [Pelobacter propionicus DSM 2379]